MSTQIISNGQVHDVSPELGSAIAALRQRQDGKGKKKKMPKFMQEMDDESMEDPEEDRMDATDEEVDELIGSIAEEASTEATARVLAAMGIDPEAEYDDEEEHFDSEEDALEALNEFVIDNIEAIAQTPAGQAWVEQIVETLAEDDDEDEVHEDSADVGLLEVAAIQDFINVFQEASPHLDGVDFDEFFTDAESSAEVIHNVKAFAVHNRMPHLDGRDDFDFTSEDDVRIAFANLAATPVVTRQDSRDRHSYMRQDSGFLGTGAQAATPRRVRAATVEPK